MTGYVYSVDTREIVVIIEGDDDEKVQEKADNLGFMGVDEYGFQYNANELIKTTNTETIDINE